MSEAVNIFGRPTEVASNGSIRVESNTSTAEELRTVLELPKEPKDAETSRDEPRSAATPEGDAAVSAEVSPPDVENEPTESELDALGLRQRNADGTFKPVKVKKRIQELLGKNRVAEARAQAAEAELTRLRAEADAARRAPSSATAKATPEPGASFSRPKPTVQDYLSEPDPYAALAEGITDWKLEQRELQQQQETRAQQARINAEQSARSDRERLAAFNARLEDARSRRADFDAVIASANAPPPPDPRWQQDFNEGITLSPEGPDILLELAQHPEEYERLTTVQNKAGLFLALGQIGARIQSRRESAAPGSTAPVVSSARPPIRPLRGGPQKTEEFPDEASMSVSEIARRDREKMAAAFNARSGRV